MQILIPIETSSRELLYKTYLSNLLAIEGFECYFGSKRNISFLINKFNNYIYLDKGYHAEVSDKLYKKIKSKNGLIINLDEEGAIDFPDGSTLKNRYSKELFDASEKVLFWGNYQAKLLKDFKLDTNKVKITGHPRFELLKKDYHNLYRDDVNKINSRFGEFILINSNFGFGNNIKGDEFVINNYGFRIKRIEEIVAFDKVKRDAYINLVKTLAKNINFKIIYRPHPEEEQSIYQDAFSGLDNVFVVFEGSVIPWLIAAKVMIHPDCTTGIESIMVGKKSISYIPENFNPEIVTQLPLKISFCINKINDIIQFIQSEQFLKNEDYNSDFNIIDNYFSYSMESSKEVVNCFNKIKLSLLNNIPNEVTLKDKIILKIRDYKLKLDNSKKTKLSKKKLSGFDVKNLNNFKNKLGKINNEINNVKIKPLSCQLFKIYK